MRSFSRALALAAILIAPAARAQVATEDINFERLQLDPGARGSLVLGTGEVGPRNAFRLSAAGHWEHLPLSLRSDQLLGRIDDGQRIVKDRVSIETAIDWVVFNNVELYARLPIIVDQKSDFADVSKTGIGTPSFGARFGLLQEASGAPVNIALAAEVWGPWGKKEALARENKATLAFRAEAGKTFGNVLVGGNIGLLDRNTVYYGNTEFGSQLQAGAVVALAKGMFRPELSYRVSQQLNGGPGSSELLGGLRAIAGPIEAFVVGGPGFGNGLGTPQWRGLAGLALRFEPSKAAPAQEAPAPAPAPVVAPPPPPDPCAAGQTHTPDQCPNLDDDGDGILNKDDACPTEKGIPETHGCPVKDSDNDGVPDHLDKCPNEAGPADNQGCPRAVISQETKRIEISEKVLFDTGKSKIKPDSDKLLSDIADLLKAHPEVKKVSIEGHTDDTGSAAVNKRLSQARANAVMNALVKLGVEKSRLEAKGFGPSRPIAPNDTPEGREANRRVEFLIKGIEQPAK